MISLLLALLLSPAALAGDFLDLNEGLQEVTLELEKEPAPETRYGRIRDRFDAAASPSSIDALRSRWSGRCFPRGAPDKVVGAMLAVETRTANTAGPIFDDPETKILIVTISDARADFVDFLPVKDAERVERFIGQMWDGMQAFTHEPDSIRGRVFGYGNRKASYFLRADEKYIYARLQHMLDFGFNQLAHCYFFKRLK